MSTVVRMLATMDYRMLLSRFPRNFPRMLIAMTRRPFSASISRIVRTVSYKMAFPTFFADSVLVATCTQLSASIYIVHVVSL